VIRPAPRFWFWSHDIQTDQIGGLVMPGMRLQRLVSYRRGAQTARRFAALYHDDLGAIVPSRTWLVDLDATTAATFGPRAEAVSVDVVPGSGEVLFTLVVDAEPNPARVLHADLDAAGMTALLDGDHTVVDVATYLRDGMRCFAAIVEPSVGRGSMFFPALTRDEVRRTLRAHGALPTRARAYHSPAGWHLAVVAERTTGTGWSVHVDVDADDVSRRIEQQHGYPLDLDAVGHGLSVRFALVVAA
jgi:hypothetical protein